MNAVFAYFLSHTGNPIIAMPTGTGKSIVIAELVRRIFHNYPDQRVQMVTHVKTLITQNFKKLLAQWPTAPAGIYSAGLKRRDFLQPIIFGGIQSMHNKTQAFGHVDLLLVDECHLIPPTSNTMYQKYISKLRNTNPLLKVIGFSATPYRLKGGHLCESGTFTDVAFDNTQREAFNKLIDEGFIAPLIPKKTGTEIDTTKLHTVAGEYVQAEIEERVGGDVTEKALQEAVTEGADRNHWLVFAVSIAHARTVTTTLNRLGVNAVEYHSEMENTAADAALADFAAGKYRAIVSRDRLTTGVDIPQVDMIVMLRPTKSPGLWVQMLGRGTRPSLDTGKKNCLVLDFAGNTRRLGPINDPVLPRATIGGGGGMAPVKVCPSCLCYIHASATVCPYCGFEIPRELKISGKASTAELIRRERQEPRELHVDHVTYKRHSKEGKPDSLCVTYFCGLLRVREFVCPDHGGNAALKARYWWERRGTQIEYPKTLEGIMHFLNFLPTPATVLVDFNGAYPEIKSAQFSACVVG